MLLTAHRWAACTTSWEGRPYSEWVTVRVLFADDSYLVREGVAGLLQETAEVELLASVGNPVELFAAVAEHRPEAMAQG